MDDVLASPERKAIMECLTLAIDIRHHAYIVPGSPAWTPLYAVERMAMVAGGKRNATARLEAAKKTRVFEWLEKVTEMQASVDDGSKRVGRVGTLPHVLVIDICKMIENVYYENDAMTVLVDGENYFLRQADQTNGHQRDAEFSDLYSALGEVYKGANATIFVKGVDQRGLVKPPLGAKYTVIDVCATLNVKLSKCRRELDDVILLTTAIYLAKHREVFVRIDSNDKMAWSWITTQNGTPVHPAWTNDSEAKLWVHRLNMHDGAYDFGSKLPALVAQRGYLAGGGVPTAWVATAAVAVMAALAARPC